MQIKQCIDEKTDKLAEQTAAPGAACPKREIRKVANGWEIDSVCTIAGMTVEGKGLITGDFVSLVKMEMTTTFKGGPTNGLSQTMTIENQRLGDCAAGQKPGDIVMPDGKVVKTPGT